MDTTHCPVRRGTYGVPEPVRYRADRTKQGNISVADSEQMNALLSSITIETPGDSRGQKAPPVLVRRQHAVSGYDRNGRRSRDERLYQQQRRRMMYVMPSLIFLIGSVVLLSSPFANQPKMLSAQQVGAVREATPPEGAALPSPVDEVPTTNYVQQYTTDPRRPRLLTIPSLGVHARVLEVGRDSRSQPQLPRNSYDVGWYNVSVLPGKTGAAVLSGACNGSVGQGVFHRLGELKHGDLIRIERGDGTTYEYTVEYVETVNVDKVNMAEALLPANSSSEGVNLIGCSGGYDVKTNDFAKRVVIYAIIQDRSG